MQIIIGVILCGLLCVNYYGGRSCFYEGRTGYTAGLNFSMLIVNIVLLVLNFLSLSSLNLERLYSIIAGIMFLVASVLLVWWLVVAILDSVETGRMIASTVLVCVQAVLYFYDVRILQGQAPN